MEKELVEKLQQSATKVLEFVEKTGESTVDFAKEQVPLVIQDILRWGIAEHSVNMVINLIILICMLVWVIKTAKPIWSRQMDDSSCPWLLCYLTYIPVVPSLCCFVSNLLVVLKITLAPRLYLLEQLRLLVK